jgi:Na+/H+-dicarboxylate symporter
LAIVLGIIVGVVFNLVNISFINDYVVGRFFGMIGKIFVNALKMLVVPLVFFALTGSLAGISDVRVLGRVSSKSFALYIVIAALAIVVALVL